MTNRTLVFEDLAGSQVLVDLWYDGPDLIEVSTATREDRGDIWSPPFDLISDEGPQ